MDNIFVLFAFGCVVFMITIAAAFCALIARDHPDGGESTRGNQTRGDSAPERLAKPVDALVK